MNEKEKQLTGKERVLKAMRCEDVDRVPWVPFVGCHGGELISVTADKYLKSKDYIVSGLEKAIELYKPDGISVMFDLQIEAEILGCGLMWAEDNPPAVTTHPLVEGVELSSLKIPKPTDGRIPVVTEAIKEMRKKHPDVALYGLITGPFTLSLHLAGTELFIKMFDDPDYVHDLMKFTTQVSNAMSDYYISAGADVIAVVDPMTSQIGPEDFRRFVTPYMMENFDKIRNRGASSSFFVCGHAQQNIEAMAECKPNNISIDENIALDYVRDVCLKQDISFGGNLQLTATLLLGSEEDVQRNALQCMDTGGERGFILAPGCDLPYATPPANLQAVTQIVHDDYQREVLRTMEMTETTKELLDMSEYGQIDKVVVDIITLDSESCAPCQYMVESVELVAPQFEGIVKWREHKIKDAESLTFMTSLMVRNIPTICIDGQITFVSRIPPRDELIAAIQKRINEKMKLRILQKQGKVYVLGGECEGCIETKNNVRRAVQELGTDMEIVFLTDEKDLQKFGVLHTPAVVVEKREVKSMGNVPSVEVIKEWIKDIT
ncbi:MAG: uroporphyrinogen decarboxylase [Calditrichaeota bacterium]|nr:uroporphyrinogen decarboxylase [Calditrichota bacterium]